MKPNYDLKPVKIEFPPVYGLVPSLLEDYTLKIPKGPKKQIQSTDDLLKDYMAEMIPL